MKCVESSYMKLNIRKLRLNLIFFYMANKKCNKGKRELATNNKNARLSIPASPVLVAGVLAVAALVSVSAAAPAALVAVSAASVGAPLAAAVRRSAIPISAPAAATAHHLPAAAHRLRAAPA